MYTTGWKTNFDYKITSVAVYATYSDGRQEKYSIPLDKHFKNIPVTSYRKENGGDRVAQVKVINAYEECNEWFSFKEGYKIPSFSEAQKKIDKIYEDVISKDYFGDVFFTFESSIKLHSDLEVSLDRDRNIQ